MHAPLQRVNIALFEAILDEQVMTIRTMPHSAQDMVRPRFAGVA
jgi:hypothetical protein